MRLIKTTKIQEEGRYYFALPLRQYAPYGVNSTKYVLWLSTKGIRFEYEVN